MEQWEERGAGYYFATPVPRSWQHFVVDVLLVFTASLTQSWPHPVPAALGMLRAHCCCQCLVLQDSHLLPYLCPFSFQQSFYKILLFLFWTICGELGFPDGYHSLRGLLCVAGRSHLSFVLFLLLQSDWLRACVQRIERHSGLLYPLTSASRTLPLHLLTLGEALDVGTPGTTGVRLEARNRNHPQTHSPATHTHTGQRQRMGDVFLSKN